MKNMMMIFACALFTANMAWANEAVDLGPDLTQQEIEAIEMEPMMSFTDLAPLTTEKQISKSSAGAVIGGAIIGGIIGAVAADHWDRGDRPRRGRIATCFAENRRGEIFRASDRWAREAQRRAMDKCFYYSRACRPLGCR